MLRRNLSLRTELILLVGALVLLATVSLGSLAYNTSRGIIESSAIHEVGITANARRQVLLQLLTQQSARATALLQTASLGCAPEEIRCLQRVLADFVGTERATGIRLVYGRHAPIVAGPRGADLAAITPPAATEIARFDFDKEGQPYYVIAAREVLRDGAMAVTLRGDAKLVNQIFEGNLGLGESGESFLTNGTGLFLTPPRYPLPAIPDRPLESEALSQCLAGNDAEVLDRDYRGVPVIQAFRSVREIGGGCIMALTDQAEAFAPTNKLRKDVVRVSALLGVLAIGCSFLFALLFSRPMDRLRERARSLRAGDFTSPVPVGGPAEVRTFARAFEAMALSLRDSRAALEETSEQMRNLLESISESFIAFDREWRCTYVNEKAIALSHISRERFLGTNLWEAFADSVSSAGRAELRRGMKQRVAVHFEEYSAPFDTWFEVDAYPTKDGLAVFGRDVTERKRINERLQQTQKLESLGVLAGGIAHDFNNLLTGIIGNASLVREELPADHEVQAGLKAVVSAAERAAILTQQLLAYAGKGRFQIQLFNLSSLVREITNLVQPSLPRTVQLRLELDERLPPMEGDLAQIQQIIMNLVINAAEAIGEGTAGTVRVKTYFREVDQAYIQQNLAANEIVPGKYIGLEVHDTGCGMDDATIRRIFDPFFTTKFAGRGLGLAAAMGIVRGHKGFLRVSSTPGKGSSFKVFFPSGAGEITPRPPVSVATVEGSGTILVVDDEPVVRRTAKSALEHHGYTVVLAENGKQGVDRFRELGDGVALVLLDMTMPGMSGEEVLGQLQRIRPDVPVILSSGYNEADAIRGFSGKGLAGFIQKPYTALHLAEQLGNALRAKV